MQYSNFQVGWAILLTCLFCGLFVLYVSNFNKNIFIPLAVILSVIILLFGFMRIEVSNNAVHWKMGVGIISGQISFDEVCSFQKSRSKWSTGWGIRRGKNFTLYNVSGFDRVSFRKCDGNIISLGTNDPEGLVNTLENNPKL